MRVAAAALLLGLLAGAALGVPAALASDPVDARVLIAQPRTYRPGPLEQRAEPAPIELPPRAEQLIALGVLGAILYGFRASGLARNAAPGRRSGPIGGA